MTLFKEEVLFFGPQIKSGVSLHAAIIARLWPFVDTKHKIITIIHCPQMLEVIGQNPFLFYTVILISSIISSALGFGSFALIPLAALYFGPKESIGIITLYFLFQNLSKLIFFKGHANLKIAKKIILWSLPGVLLGALLLGYVPEKGFEKGLAIVMILFILNDFHHFVTKKQNRKSLPLFSLLYGFCSGLFGSGNLIKGPLFISLGLVKESYIATYALTSLFMNFPKIGIYFWNGIIKPSTMMASLPFLGISIVGTYCGKKILKKIDHSLFHSVITAFFLLSALALLFK